MSEIRLVVFQCVTFDGQVFDFPMPTENAPPLSGFINMAANIGWFHGSSISIRYGDVRRIFRAEATGNMPNPGIYAPSAGSA